MQLQAYPGDPTFVLSLLGKCMNLDSNVEVPNSQIIIWLASTLVECPPTCRRVLYWRMERKLVKFFLIFVSVAHIFSTRKVFTVLAYF